MLVDNAVYINEIRHEGHDPANSGGFSQVGILDPTQSELDDYKHHFHFNDHALEDAVSIRQRPNLDNFESHSFLVLKTVAYSEVSHSITIGELSPLPQ